MASYWDKYKTEAGVKQNEQVSGSTATTTPPETTVKKTQTTSSYWDKYKTEQGAPQAAPAKQQTETKESTVTSDQYGGGARRTVDTETGVVTSRLPDILGGGEYMTMPDKKTPYVTPRQVTEDQKNEVRDGTFLATQKEVDHIIPKALGGTDVNYNLQALRDEKTISQTLFDALTGNKRLPEDYKPKNRQEGKMVVEWKAIDKYKKGEIDLPEARAAVINWEHPEVFLREKPQKTLTDKAWDLYDETIGNAYKQLHGAAERVIPNVDQKVAYLYDKSKEFVSDTIDFLKEAERQYKGGGWSAKGELLKGAGVALGQDIAQAERASVGAAEFGAGALERFAPTPTTRVIAGVAKDIYAAVKPSITKATEKADEYLSKIRPKEGLENVYKVGEFVGHTAPYVAGDYLIAKSLTALPAAVKTAPKIMKAIEFGGRATSWVGTGQVLYRGTPEEGSRVDRAVTDLATFGLFEVGGALIKGALKFGARALPENIRLRIKAEAPKGEPIKESPIETVRTNLSEEGKATLGQIERGENVFLPQVESLVEEVKAIKDPGTVIIPSASGDIKVSTNQKFRLQNYIKGMEDVEFKIAKNLGKDIEGRPVTSKYEYNPKTGKSTIYATNKTTAQSLAHEFGHYFDRKTSAVVGEKFSEFLPQYSRYKQQVNASLTSYAVEKLGGNADSKAIAKFVDEFVAKITPQIDELAKLAGEVRSKISEKYASAVGWTINNIEKAKKVAPEFAGWIENSLKNEGIIKPPKTRAQVIKDAYQFYSPNIEESVDFVKAQKELRSENLAKGRLIAEDIDAQLGLKGETHNAVGDTKEWGAEASLYKKFDNIDWETNRYSTALKGRAMKQKGVIAFIGQEGGKDSLYLLDIPSRDMVSLRADLDANGLLFRTIEETPKTTKVIIFDQGTTLATNVKSLSEKYGITPEWRAGKGEFIGGDTRAEGLRAYNKVINEYESSRPGIQRYDQERAGMAAPRPIGQTTEALKIKSLPRDEERIARVLKEQTARIPKEALEEVTKAAELMKKTGDTQHQFAKALDAQGVPVKNKQGITIYKDERAAMHNRILERPEYNKPGATPKRGEKPVAVIFAGRPGAGKSTVLGEKFDTNKFIVLNPDDFKASEFIPESTQYNAPTVHEEASDIYKKALRKAISEKKNILLDITAKDAKKVTTEYIGGLKKLGYQVEGYESYITPEISVERVVDRLLSGLKKGKGRYVPPEISTTPEFETAFEKFKDKLDYYESYSNVQPQGEKPALLSKSGGTSLAQKPAGAEIAPIEKAVPVVEKVKEVVVEKPVVKEVPTVQEIPAVTEKQPVEKIVEQYKGKPIPTKAFNEAKFNGSDDVMSLLNGVTESNKEFADIRRSTTLEEQKMFSQKYLGDEALYKDLPAEIRENTGKMLAAEQTMIDMAENLRSRLKEFDLSALTDAQKQEIRESLIKLEAVSKAFAGARSTTAQMFGSLRNEMTATENDLFQELMASLKKAGQETTSIEGFIKKEKELVSPTLGDKAWHLYYASMLSGPGTHLKNILGNVGSILPEYARMGFTAPKEFIPAFKGALEGFKTGVEKAKEIWKVGDVSKFEVRGKTPIEFKGKYTKALNALDYVGRALAAVDAIAKGVAKGTEVGAITKGLRAATEEELKIANQFSELMTFTNKPRGIANMFSSVAGTVQQKVPGGRMVVPFVNIVSNVIDRGLAWTPLGIKRGVVRPIKIGSTTWLKEGGLFGEYGFTSSRERMQELARGVMGTAAMTMFAGMASTDRLSGNGPADKSKRQQLEATGWRADSVKIGNRWYPYTNWGSLAMPMAIVGNYFDAKKYGKQKDVDLTERAIAAITGTGSTILEMSFLSGVSDFTKIFTDPLQSGKKAKQFISRTASSVVPNTVKQIARIFNPTMYEQKTIRDMIQSNTRVTVGLKPSLNVFGEVREGSRLYGLAPGPNVRYGDKTVQMLTDKGIWVQFPGRTTKFKPRGEKGSRQMDDDEYYTFIKESGHVIKNRLDKESLKISKMNASAASDYVDKIVADERKRVKQKMESGAIKVER